MSRFTHWLSDVVGLGTSTQRQLLQTLIVIGVLALVRMALVATTQRRTTDISTRYRWRKTITYFTVGTGLVLVGRVWFEGVGSLVTFFGLLSAGLAIALKDLVANLAGWVFILWRRPFEVGDRIQIGEHAGDVIDIRIFQFTLLEIGNWVAADQSTGRMVHVPNGRVLSEVLANYTKGFQYIWNEIPVLVTFESNWRDAKALLEHIATHHAASVTTEAARQIEDASQRFMIVYNKLTPVVYTSVSDSGVLLTARYLCSARERRATSEAIWEEILTTFAGRTDIDFAYPTTRFYSEAAEGKRAPSRQGVQP